MKIKTALQFFLPAVLAAAIVFTGCNGNPSKLSSGGDISPGNSPIILTLYSSKQLTWTSASADAGKKITWTSSAPSVVSVDANGKITAVGVTDYLTDKYTIIPAIGSAVITAKTGDGGRTATFTVTTIMTPQVDLLTLPPLKDQFSKYFMLGNIATTYDANSGGTEITKQSLLRHYNVLTAENDMKPNSYGGDANSLNYIRSDRFVNAARSSGFKVHGHTLLWHSQNAQWITDMASASSATALAAMKKYITDVCTHFKGKIYSWDVLNEAFPDGVNLAANWKTAIRPENPWFKSIGPDFIYEGFLAARKADPDAILYYNDFNTDQIGKAMMIHDMVKEVNDKYLALPSGSKPAGDPANRLLIEGIGMQEHHNTGVTAAAIRDAIKIFRPLGVKLSVSEIDVLAQSWNEFDKNNPVTNQGLVNQADLYGEYMKLYIENADIIERVTFWGVTDSQSWRGRGLPLLFDKDGKAKPSYYKVIEALE